MLDKERNQVPVPVFELKGQSHKKVGKIKAWGVFLGPN
jgi:hypothetical protein